MNIKNLFKLKKESKKEETQFAETTCIDDAQFAANAVDVSVQSGDLSSLAGKLDFLAYKYDDKNSYIFKYHSYVLMCLITGVSAIFSAIFLYFAVISVATLILSAENRILAVAGLILSLAVIIINAVIISKSVCQIKFSNRFNKYFEMLKYKNIEIVSDLALFSNISEDVVVNDLTKAVQDKLIPQGHFGRNNIIFILNDTLFEEYNKKPAVYDRYYLQQIEERERINTRTEKMQQVLDTGKMYIEKIHDSNDIIKDKAISKKLDEMEKIVSTIFHEVDINPNQSDKLGMFLNYYLPTTEKLLLSFIDLSEKSPDVKKAAKAKSDIESELDKLNAAFEGILDKFYTEQELDLYGEISAMEIIMKQEGLDNQGGE